MSGKGRPKRVGEVIRHEIASLLVKGLKDPRIGFVSIMEVRMSPDLQYANVYVSLMGSEAERKGSLIGLRHSSGWIRREVGKALRMRVTPEIRFFPDDTLDQVYHLEQVFEEIHQEQQAAPMLRLSLEGLLEELHSHNSFLLTSHVHPDGDAVGSLLGVAHFLHALGKSVAAVVLHDPIPEAYTNLPGAKQVKIHPEQCPEFDAAVVIDVAQRERIGDIADFIGPEKRLIVIDHHLSEGPANAVGFIDPTYAASGEIVADLYEAAGLEISVPAAHCIYVAQSTDTGGYRFSNTNARSHRIAARLLDTGLDVGPISRRVFDVTPKPKFELMRRMADRLEMSMEGRFAHSYLTRQDIDETGARREHIDSLINIARNIEGVEVAALFFGSEPDTTKVSLRSEPTFNSAAFLEGYGGGGHAAAAGATVGRPLSELREEVVAHIEAELAQRSEGTPS